MAYEIKITKNFKKNVELCKRRGYPMNLLRDALDILIEIEERKKYSSKNFAISEKMLNFALAKPKGVQMAG